VSSQHPRLNASKNNKDVPKLVLEYKPKKIHRRGKIMQIMARKVEQGSI
jgi:hypothetical protein